MNFSASFGVLLLAYFFLLGILLELIQVIHIFFRMWFILLRFYILYHSVVFFQNLSFDLLYIPFIIYD